MMEYDRGYMADTPMLEVRDLTKQYKGFLLDKVSFTLPKGFIMGYVGPNGAGKSTTLGLITKTHRADAGEVLLDGKRYEEDPISYKEKIGYVSSVSYFRPTMNIKDAVLLLRQFYPTFSKEKFYLCKSLGSAGEEKILCLFHRNDGKTDVCRGAVERDEASDPGRGHKRSGYFIPGGDP